MNAAILPVAKRTSAARSRMSIALVATILSVACGCSSAVPSPAIIAGTEYNSEHVLRSLPSYQIQASDVLDIDMVHAVPKAPYRIQPRDELHIEVAGTLPNQPILGDYTVEEQGTVNFGSSYGRVSVSGMSAAEATDAVDKHLQSLLPEPEVSIKIAAIAGERQIIGEHLVHADGTIDLGTYGSVKVNGLSLTQAKRLIEKQLSPFLGEPKVSLDVLSSNSNTCYVIYSRNGKNDTVTPMVLSGNETAIDAIVAVDGLTQIGKKRVWIARSWPGRNCYQILPVDVNAILKSSKVGSTATNYTLLPGDIIYVEDDPGWIAEIISNKIVSPIERLFGFTLIGSSCDQHLVTIPASPEKRDADNRDNDSP